MPTLDHSPVATSADILGGTRVFRGTRVPVQTRLDYVQDGFYVDQFIEIFPSVSPGGALEFLRLVRADSGYRRGSME
jgi:uncharacterized protein (DUF433 family)